jgi:hypothetical protein
MSKETTNDIFLRVFNKQLQTCNDYYERTILISFMDDYNKKEQNIIQK